MPALSPAGLAGLPDASTLSMQGGGSASPTRFGVDKSTRFSSRFSLDSDVSLLHSTVTTVLEPPQSARVLTQGTATTDSPARPGDPSEGTGDLARPAKPSVAKRSKSANARRNGMSPGTDRGRQPRSARDRPASSGGLPPTWKPERTGRPEGDPSRAVRCWSVPSRWSL